MALALRITSTLPPQFTLSGYIAGQRAIAKETGFMFATRELPGNTIHSYYEVDSSTVTACAMAGIEVSR